MFCLALGAAAACGDEDPYYGPELDGSVEIYDGGPYDGTTADTAPTIPPNQVGCSEEAKLVYVVDRTYGLHSFHPGTLTFKRIGTLNCPDPGLNSFGGPASPNSMAVDRTGVAWVHYNSGKLFKVSTVDGACAGTPFDYTKFGLAPAALLMGFSSDATKEETLYGVSAKVDDGGITPPFLAKIDLTTFTLTPVGNFTDGLMDRPAELTGNGDGQLFGFFTTNPATLAAIDLKTGATAATTQKTLTGVVAGDAYAFSFWGGDFWFYTSNPGETSNVTQYKKSGDGSINVVKTAIGFNIVGAGVSTCAPTK
jgi:hypothetical protein